MPIYEYACSQCGKTFDVMQKVSDPAPEKCEACGSTGTLSKMVSRTSFVLKGGGWYSDLYGSTKKGSGGSESSSSSSSSSASSSSSSSTTSSSSSTGSGGKS
jgi:putative FmdB family regulatory protein